MEDYKVEGRLITKDDWENWLKSKEEYSDRHLSNMPETSAKKESRYAVIEWHPYPEEKPNKDDEYLVSVNMWNKSFTSTSSWITSNSVFEDIWDERIYAWAEKPGPYKEEGNNMEGQE